MRSGCGPTESRMSPVSGMGVGIFATTPLAPMKPMISGSGAAPVALGQRYCSVTWDWTTASPHLERIGPNRNGPQAAPTSGKASCGATA